MAAALPGRLAVEINYFVPALIPTEYKHNLKNGYVFGSVVFTATYALERKNAVFVALNSLKETLGYSGKIGNGILKARYANQVSRIEFRRCDRYRTKT